MKIKFKNLIIILCCIQLVSSKQGSENVEDKTDERAKDTLYEGNEKNNSVLSELLETSTITQDLTIVELTTAQSITEEETTTLQSDAENLQETKSSSDQNMIINSEKDKNETRTQTIEVTYEIVPIKNEETVLIEIAETTTLSSQINNTEESTTLLVEEEVTTTPIPDETTTVLSQDKPNNSEELTNYALTQMNFILDHILQTSYDFVSHLLQETDNTLEQRDKLKRYAEILHHLLSYSREDNSDYDEPPQDPYNLIMKKLTFLKSRATKFLHKYLPSEWQQIYFNKKQEISIWLDKAAEQMREECNSYLTSEEDAVKLQYFNESFDDIPRANEIHQKIVILLDLVKIATNKKTITFMDLYMQS